MKLQDYPPIVVPADYAETSFEQEKRRVNFQEMTFAEYQAVLEAGLRQAEQWRQRYVQALAAMDNSRKQAERNAEVHSRQRLRSFCRQLIEVADNLERALGCISAGHPVHIGLTTTLEQLRHSLHDMGVEPIIVEPETLFDPQIHEALCVRQANVLDIIVVEIRRTGYRLGDEILRPALVIVARPMA